MSDTGQSSDHAPGKVLTVLIAEDDAETRDSLRLVLESAGYHVVAVSNGVDALRYLRANERPALIILDLKMPGMDGWTFCRIRRGDERLSSIPLVIASAAAGPSRRQPYIGIDAIIAKPFDDATLLDVVRSYAR